MSQHPSNILSLGKKLALTALIGTLASCGHSSGRTIEVRQTSGYQPHHGPFDSKGNYIDQWADNPPKRRYISGRKSKKSTKPTPTSQYVAKTPPAATSSSPKSKSKAKAISSRPKPVAKKPTKVAVKPRTKPPISHKVKKGDTLYGLSRKYKTSVGSIQRANNIKGSNIRLGQSLKIPRK